MNKIEQQFYDTFLEGLELADGTFDMEHCYLKPHVQIGPYVVDFLFREKIIVEIDGHEYHKTKEQRFNDYTRERYFMKQGYFVVRFMGTEVFIDAEKCIEELQDISLAIDEIMNVEFGKGLYAGREGN